MRKIGIFIFIMVIITSCVSVQGNKDVAFEYYELENGIPVIVNKTDSSQIISLQISVKGGTALIEPEYSGIESSLFEMMTLGSNAYPYSEIQKILYNTQGSMYASSNQLGSTLGLVSIDYYFDELLPVFIDGFLNPVFGEQEYTTLMTSISQSLQFKLEDPNTVLTESIIDSRYTNHPYAASSNVTNDSIENITIPNMQKHLTGIHNANRLAVIAVGNVDGMKLVQALNKTLGLIESTEIDFPSIPEATVGGSTLVNELSSAAGSGYVAYTVSAPKPGSEDEIAFRIASDIYSETLFNVVREHYGAVYSIGASYTYSKAPFGTLRAYKVSDLENIAKYIAEAETLLFENKVISGKDESTQEFIYDTIENRLEGYKNTLINSQYYSSQTNAGTSAQIRSSMLMFNNPEQYLTFTDRVRDVSANDVKKAFEKYWVNGEKQWFAVTGIGEKSQFLEVHSY